MQAFTFVDCVMHAVILDLTDAAGKKRGHCIVSFSQRFLHCLRRLDVKKDYTL